MHIYIYIICIEGDGTTRNYQNDHRCNPKTRIISLLPVCRSSRQSWVSSKLNGIGGGLMGFNGI